MHEMPEVSTIAPFEPHSHLQEGWQVKEWVLGRRMKLAQDSLEAWRRLKSRIGATLIAGFLTVLLVWGAPFSEGGLGWAVLPLTLLFGLVTLLGLLSMYAGFTALRRGVVLELDADSQTVEGHPEPHTQILKSFRDFRHHRLQKPLADVEKVIVRVVPATKPQEISHAVVFVQLRNQSQKWVGPSAWALPQDENAARDALCPLAAELARIARCSLRIEYVDSNDFDEVTADEIARHRASTAPSSFSAT